jgi:hypothetical protein
MAITGKILMVLGVGLLLLAGFFFLDATLSTEGWGPSGARFGLIIAQFPGAPGVCALLLGIYLVRRAHKLREANEAMEWNNRSLRGVVHDPYGSPIPKATVDVFIEGSQGSQPVATMQTDARGRFSTDLPEGRYLLEVGVPELDEFSRQVEISKSGNTAELTVILEVDPRTA